MNSVATTNSKEEDSHMLLLDNEHYTYSAFPSQRHYYRYRRTIYT
jgi:hypothetical protein